MSLRCKTIFIKSLFMMMVVGIIGSLSACAIFEQEKEVLVPPLAKPKQEQYQVVNVKKGTIINAIKGDGTIVSTMEYPLYFKTGGRLESIDVKTGDQVKKGQVLARLDAGDLDYQLELARLDVQKAQLDVDRAQDALNDAKRILEREKSKEVNGDPSADVNGAQAAVRNIEYGLKQAQLSLNTVKINLDKLQKQKDGTELVSPINGTVTFKETVKEGDDIPPYKALVRVADPKDLQVSFDVSQLANAMIVKPGMKAELTVNDKTVIGEVVSCPYSAPLTPDNDDKAPAPIIIRASELPEGVALGDNVFVNIVLEKKDNALIVPRNAVHSYMDRNYVEVLIGDAKSEVDVEIGIESATEVEIVSGLKEGQQVVIK